MQEEIVARWRAAAGHGLEHCCVQPQGDGAEIVALVIAPDGFAARYRIGCDARWRVREAEIDVAGTGKRLVLRSDGAGRWNADGAPRPDLDGAHDIDISVTPFTNTLPIRRLALGIAAAAEIAVAYVDMPSLTLSRRPQRYTRLAERLWRFETLDMDFAAEIAVDGEGLVVDYPGLFRRVG